MINELEKDFRFLSQRSSSGSSKFRNCFKIYLQIQSLQWIIASATSHSSAWMKMKIGEWRISQNSKKFAKIIKSRSKKLLQTPFWHRAREMRNMKWCSIFFLFARVSDFSAHQKKKFVETVFIGKRWWSPKGSVRLIWIKLHWCLKWNR